MSSNPKKNPAMRRMRPNYPALKPGESIKLDRPECGQNIERMFPVRAKDGSILPIQPKRTPKVLRGKFILTRSVHVSRNKYPKSEVARASVARESAS